MRTRLVGLGRVELPTSPLSGVRSSQLSYRPVEKPGTNWWSWSGSNRRPPECKSGALPAELQPLDHRLRPSTLHAGISWPARRWPEFKSRPIGCRAADSRPATTLTTSMNFEQESETYFRHSAADRQKTDNRRLCSGLDWDGFHSYTQSEPSHVLFRKEVIQPQVLLRLPCYDFTPIMNHTLGRCLPCGLARRLLVQSTFVM